MLKGRIWVFGFAAFCSLAETSVTFAGELIGVKDSSTRLLERSQNQKPANETKLIVREIQTPNEAPTLMPVSETRSEITLGAWVNSNIIELNETRAAFWRDQHVKIQLTTHLKDTPLSAQKRIQAWVHYFSAHEHLGFQRSMNRGADYSEMIAHEIKDAALPQELYYLALVESGFAPIAKSGAAAVGLWQFIRPTAQIYGLEADHFIDERRHPVQATRAALAHLRDLYNEFKSWPLSLAAYNAGAQRVRTAIRKGKTRDFWKLAERRLLPNETIHYVPKFIAAVIIGTHPKWFGFKDSETKNKYPDVESVIVSNSKNIPNLVKQNGITIAEFDRINTHLLKNVDFSKKRKFRVWIPKKNIQIVSAEVSPTIRMIETDVDSNRDPSLRLLSNQLRENAVGRISL